MTTAKKITVDVPEDILKKAQAETGEGISETVRRGLQILAAASAYKKLLELEGKVKFARSWKEIKEDRK